MKKGLSWGQRRQLYEQAEAQIDNGVTLQAVLLDFAARLKRRRKDAAALIVEDIHQQVRDGSTLTAAMGEDLTDLERDVLAAGEKGKGGGLPEAMRLVIEVRELIDSMRLKLLQSFMTPGLFLVVLYATLAIIGMFVVPNLTGVLPLRKWTGWAYVMYLMGEVAVGWMAPLVFGSLVGYAIWSARALSRWTGSRRTYFDRNLFPFTIYAEVTGFRWLRSYVALVRSGVPEVAALKGQIATASPWLASRLTPVHVGMEFGGLNLAAALRSSGYDFPTPDLIDEVGAYVGFDNFAEKLEVALTKYAKKLERKLLIKGAVISAVFSVVMFCAFVVVALGSNSVSSLMSTSMGQ
ncbi:type II secretion system F family protein [Ralstonia pseudosolanacearum]|uniref:type II secretion system F family protein n=1 Tax=Ralstonia pseudosolanacearum TaxID=1310165 RepID=UPI004053F5BB